MANQRQVLRGLANYLQEFKDRQPLLSAYSDPGSLPFFDSLHPVAVAYYLNLGSVPNYTYDTTGVNGRWNAWATDCSNRGIGRKSVMFCPSETNNAIYNPAATGNPISVGSDGWMQLGSYAADWWSWTPRVPKDSYIYTGGALQTQPDLLDGLMGKNLASLEHPDRSPCYLHAQYRNISCYGMANGVNTVGAWTISGPARNQYGDYEPTNHNGRSPIGWFDGHVTYITMDNLLNDYRNGGPQYGPTGLSPIWDYGCFTPW